MTFDIKSYLRPEGYVVLDYKCIMGGLGPEAYKNEKGGWSTGHWMYNGYVVFHARVDDYSFMVGHRYGERLFGNDFAGALKYAYDLEKLFPGSFIHLEKVLVRDTPLVPKELEKYLEME